MPEPQHSNTGEYLLVNGRRGGDWFTLREFIEEKFKNADKALELQAKETERRLELLNGEAERLRTMQATYLPREVFEVCCKEMATKTESLQKLVYIGIGIVLVLQVVVKFLHF